MKSSGALTAPLDNLTSNWAYMVIASLAWSLKIWSGLMIRPSGSVAKKKREQETKRRVVRMEFNTFRQTLMQIEQDLVRSPRSDVQLSHKDTSLNSQTIPP